MNIFEKIKRKWAKLRLRPIRVYCLHHVCAQFDSESMNECDWMQIDKFKRKVLALQQNGVAFISLTEAYCHICNDLFRSKEYAVLTFDDGYASLKEILPWLEEQKIPVTLFVNGKYLDGQSYRENPKEQYLTGEELLMITSPSIEIGSHGWEHKSALQQSEIEFKESVERNLHILSAHPQCIPFHAYTYGKYKKHHEQALIDLGVHPVSIDGNKNFNDAMCIHRELMYNV